MERNRHPHKPPTEVKNYYLQSGAQLIIRTRHIKYSYAMAQPFTSKNLSVDPKEILTVTMAKVFTAALLITVDSEKSFNTILYSTKLYR